ncbi:ankyrin repeat domain-containing protein [Rickettsia bellii]|uniref:Putative ankyrin repeat protein RBE_0623 n=1 Tax=Rickettsia bellii (strain RML369-C) TaxID=336407 RepID=Y623_RICBR|nr:ankyrin repeat domain-containing protein [Rickettsia bellii]Q1RIW0.1 RecName: Full=Putative ankyrin repeat protein RBE_0623 [Rickettsia bellii RML369-C]ABE04704.1 Ankyrin repeat [Rickettsia bellii RML369-C]
MPKTINNYNRFLPVVHFSQTELEESLCNAVIHNDKKAAEIAIFKLNISDNFTSDLRTNKSYIDDTHNIFIGDSLPLVAVKNNNLDMLKMLLSCGFEPNTPAAANCYTPLWYVTYKGYTNSVRKLLEYPINNINETFGKETPLKSALIHKHTEIAKLLIDKINPDKFLFNGVENIALLAHDQFMFIINEISTDKKISLFKLCSKNITEHQDFILFGKGEAEINNMHINNTYMLDYLDNNHDDSTTIIGSID